jgi:hypothetical protein
LPFRSSKEQQSAAKGGTTSMHLNRCIPNSMMIRYGVGARADSGAQSLQFNRTCVRLTSLLSMTMLICASSLSPC